MTSSCSADLVRPGLVSASPAFNQKKRTKPDDGFLKIAFDEVNFGELKMLPLT